MPGEQLPRRRRRSAPIDGFGALRAIDPATGSGAGNFHYTSQSWAGVLSTASGLVFAGDIDGNVMAFDARTRQEPLALPDRSALYAGRRPPTCSTAGSTC